MIKKEESYSAQGRLEVHKRNVIDDPAPGSEGEAVQYPGDVGLDPGVDGRHAPGPAPPWSETDHPHLQHPGVIVTGHHLGTVTM